VPMGVICGSHRTLSDDGRSRRAPPTTGAGTTRERRGDVVKRSHQVGLLLAGEPAAAWPRAALRAASGSPRRRRATHLQPAGTTPRLAAEALPRVTPGPRRRPHDRPAVRLPPGRPGPPRPARSLDGEDHLSFSCRTCSPRRPRPAMGLNVQTGPLGPPSKRPARSLAVALPQVASNAMDDREVTSTPMDLLHPNGSGPLWGMASRDLNATSW
jgi:hypothetical protein